MFIKWWVWLESHICLGWTKLPLGSVSILSYRILSSYPADSICRDSMDMQLTIQTKISQNLRNLSINLSQGCKRAKIGFALSSDSVILNLHKTLTEIKSVCLGSVNVL